MQYIIPTYMHISTCTLGMYLLVQKLEAVPWVALDFRLLRPPVHAAPPPVPGLISGAGTYSTYSMYTPQPYSSSYMHMQYPHGHICYAHVMHMLTMRHFIFRI